MRKPSKKTLKAKADKLFRDKVRSKGYCELAGLDKIRCGGNLQTMHIIGRSNYNLRWDSLNALCGCAGHHRWYTSHPFEFYALIQTHWPDKYKYLMQYKNEFWDKDYDRVINELKEWRPQ